MQETKPGWSMRDYDMFLAGMEKGENETYRYLVRRHKEMGKSAEEIAGILSLPVEDARKYKEEIAQDTRSWQPVS